MSETKTTYRLADGSMIYGEYSYVDGLDGWWDDDEPVELVKEIWTLVSSERFTYEPPLVQLRREAEADDEES